MAGLNKGVSPPTEIKLHQKSRVLKRMQEAGASREPPKGKAWLVARSPLLACGSGVWKTRNEKRGASHSL